MEDKNIIIANYSRSLVDAANSISNIAGTLNSNENENKATIKTLNVLIESLRSQTVLIQGEIDSY